MSNHWILGGLTGLIVAVSAVANAANDSSTSAPSAWDKVKAYSHEKRHEAIAYGRSLIDEADKKIKDLESRAAQSTGEVKQGYEQNIKELKAKRDAAYASLNKMEHSASGAWGATKQGFSDAYKDLQQAYEKASAAIKGQ
jgi:Spy/CpxP family protein refolding chaperone